MEVFRKSPIVSSKGNCVGVIHFLCLKAKEKATAVLFTWKGAGF